MYHSITFGDKNTYDDWHLMPSSRPVFNPPEVKMKTIDLPGANGVLDMSEALTGYPLFNNRKGSFEFYVLNDYWNSWKDAYSSISNYIHGRQMKAILDDDKTYYYFGRFAVNEWKSEEGHSKIVIDYNVDPYKYLVTGLPERWMWDPFNFLTDRVPETKFSEIKVPTGGITLEFSEMNYGKMPVSPIVTCSAPVTMVFKNETLGLNETIALKAGENKFTNFDDVIFYGPKVSCRFETDAEVAISMDFRAGSL